MAKDRTLQIRLTHKEATALMEMLDSEFETLYGAFSEGLDLKEWENLDLDAYKILAFHKYKQWYWGNYCD